MKKRSSILIYFDNFHLIAGLSHEQLGILFRALMESGELEACGQDGISGFERRYPEMDERTQMAFCFMADTLRRDTVAYNEKCANYRAAAQRRAESMQETASPARPQSRSARKRPSAEEAQEEITRCAREVLARKREQRQAREASSAPVD